MLRFAAAVLAVAATTPTPAEKGFARLSEALASPAVVNNDVLWTRCGVLDKMAPHSAMLLHSDWGGAVVGGDGTDAELSMLHACTALMVWMWTSASRRAGRVPYLVWYASGGNACS